MKNKTFYIILMCAFSAMLGLGIISPFLPELVARHRANGFWMGMIFAGFAISRGIVMPFVGRESDKVGRKVFMSSGLFLFSLISLFYPHAHNMYDLTLVRMVHGLAAGMIIPIVMAYAGEFAEKGKEGSVAGTITMMFYLGLASGPIIGGEIYQAFGFHAVFYAMSALAFIAFLIVLFFLPESGNPKVKAKYDGISFRALMKYDHIKALLIIAAISTFMTTIFLSFVPALAYKRHIDTEHIAIILSVGILLASLLQIPFGKFSDRLSRTGKMFQISFGTSLSMCALFIMPLCPDFGALLGAGALMGAGISIATPALISVSMGIGKQVGMGNWMGIINTAQSLGFMLGPLLAGIIMDMLGIDRTFYILALLAFSGGLVYFHFLHNRIKKAETQEA
ncbi:MAG: MFS transporter [Candidatus Tantalella remota]|nr:MFS transporter [Candidatus Tantalella remota]